jgi:flagellar motor switch/type III secretory pathway protein FliN
MAANPVPLPNHPQQQKPEPHENAPVTALASAQPATDDESGLRFEGPIVRLPVQLDVGVPIRDFRVRNLVTLEPGVVVASQWPHVDDLPVLSGHQPLAWSEFEVVDSRLAVRLTRLP